MIDVNSVLHSPMAVQRLAQESPNSGETQFCFQERRQTSRLQDPKQEEQEILAMHIKQYIQKRGVCPETTSDYYKFVK